MVWHQLERVQVDFEYQIQQNTSHNRKIPNVWAAGIAARESIKKNYMYTTYTRVWSYQGDVTLSRQLAVVLVSLHHRPSSLAVLLHWCITN